MPHGIFPASKPCVRLSPHTAFPVVYSLTCWLQNKSAPELWYCCLTSPVAVLLKQAMLYTLLDMLGKLFNTLLSYR